MKTNNAPRLRCVSKSKNGFYGKYKGCIVSVRRDNKSRPWVILVSVADGTYIVDGYADATMTMREAIVHAVNMANINKG